jgi:ABC-type amino acid transport substrate-binding protein
VTRFRLVQAAAALLVACGVAQAADLDAVKKKGVIRIAVANEIPYGYMDMSGAAKGAGPEVAKHIADKLGIARIEWLRRGGGRNGHPAAALREGAVLRAQQLVR